jgi:hypothetical protein
MWALSVLPRGTLSSEWLALLRQARMGRPAELATRKVLGHSERNVIAHRMNTRPRTYLRFAAPLDVNAHLRHHSPVVHGT